VSVNDAYRGYVARRYGKTMLEAAGIETALGGPAVAMPVDPLFPLWFEGARTAVAAGGRAPDSAALLAVIRLGEKFATHPLCGQRLRERAASARERAGIPPPRVVFEMAFTRPPSVR
jgi:hypothetical protein